MARRRARKDALLPALFVLGIVLYVLPNWLSRISLLAFLTALWLGFFKKTTCDVKNFSAPGYCHRDCHGILRACSLSSHKREKRATILAWLGIRSRSPRRWERRDPRAPYGSVEALYTPGEALLQPGIDVPLRVSLERDGFDRAIFFMTILSTAGTVLPVLLGRL
jgi:hypothetical protein